MERTTSSTQLMTRAFKFTALIASLLLFSAVVHLFSSGDGQDGRRELAENGQFLPNDGRYFEWAGKKVPNITSQQLPKLMKKVLIKKMNKDKTNEEIEKEEKEVMSMENINKAVDILSTEMESSDGNTFLDVGKGRKHRFIGPLVEALPGVNNFDYALKHDKKMDHAAKNRLVEHLGSQFEKQHDKNSLAQLFDIIVLTGKTSTSVLFLDKWKDWIQDMHVIIVQQGDPERVVEIPAWVDYELFTKVEVEKAVGEGMMYMFDMDGDSIAAYNFGLIVADRELVYFIDRNFVPVRAKTEPGQTQAPDDNLLLVHARALVRPSLIYYYNSPTHDPYGVGSDFKRGYPYSLREGVQTALSVGQVAGAGADEFDHLTQLFKPAVQSAGAGATADLESPLVNTVPHKSLFSLTTKNIAFSRKILGPTFLFFSATAFRPKHADFEINEETYHLILGWFLKVIGDHVGYGVKDIAAPAFLRHEPGLAPDEISGSGGGGLRGGTSKALKEDLFWLEYSEAVVRFFNHVVLSDRTINDVPDATRELSGKMRDSKIHPIFNDMADLMEDFSGLWNKKNGFNQQLFPVARRSSAGPRPENPHQCAMFTIAHNETSMLEVWVRYYAEHFPNSIWVLNHLSGDDAKANEVHVDPGLLSKVRVVNLYGDKAGFPMGFFTTQADLMQRRLLRWGYLCVMLSDVDEMAVPNPVTYPNGLKQYIAKFQADPEKVHMRVNGYIIAHISNPDGDENDRIEPAIDWSKSILGQRRYMMPQGKYCKPLLSKVPLRYKAGFHTVFIPGFIPMDPDFMMFHLREIDRDFCLVREQNKHNLIKRGHQSEIDKVLNVHIVQHDTLLKKGEVCAFALGTYYRKWTKAVDNTGKNTLEEIPAPYREVSL